MGRRLEVSLCRFPHTRGGEPCSRSRKPRCKAVFPTHVGVNRMVKHTHTPEGGFPHTRGGEPAHRVYRGTRVAVFPTHVGVNRLWHIGFYVL